MVTLEYEKYFLGKIQTAIILKRINMVDGIYLETIDTSTASTFGSAMGAIIHLRWLFYGAFTPLEYND